MSSIERGRHYSELLKEEVCKYLTPDQCAKLYEIVTDICAAVHPDAAGEYFDDFIEGLNE